MRLVSGRAALASVSRASPRLSLSTKASSEIEWDKLDTDNIALPDIFSVFYDHSAELKRQRRGESTGYHRREVDKKLFLLINRLETLINESSAATSTTNASTTNNIEFRPYNIVSVMHVTKFDICKKNADLFTKVVDMLVLMGNQCRTEFTMKHISSIFLLMKGMKSENKQVRQLLSAITRHVHMSTHVFDARAIWCALYGLQDMEVKYAEVRTCLNLILEKIKQCREPLDAQAIGLALFGMVSRSSNEEIVRDVFRALLPKIKACTQPMSPQNWSNALYGLALCDTEHKVVRELLCELYAKSATITGTLSVQELTGAFYGLKLMSSDVQEVGNILKLLMDMLSQSAEPFDALAVGNMAYSLMNKDSKMQLVKELLVIIAEKNETCTQQLQPRHIAQALNGLQHMTSDHEEVLLYIRSFNKLSKSRNLLTGKQVENILIGLRYMDPTLPDVLSLFESMCELVGKETMRDVQHAMKITKNKKILKTDTEYKNHFHRNLAFIAKKVLGPEAYKASVTSSTKGHNSNSNSSRTSSNRNRRPTPKDGRGKFSAKTTDDVSRG